MNIKLRPFKDEEYEYKKMYEWCSKAHVYEWFEQRILSIDEIRTKYRNKLGKQDMYIIKYNNKDIGYVQIYKYKPNVYEFDLFIGEKDLVSKGLGPEILDYIKNKIYSEYKAESIIARPFKRNIGSVKCLLKSSFKQIDEYGGTDTLGNPETILVMENKRTN